MTQQKQETQYLAQGSFAEQTGWRRRQELVDSLAYIDDVTPEEKVQIKSMIEDEMKSMDLSPSDYLKEIPTYPETNFEEGSLLASEMERVSKGKPLEAIDLSRYEVPPPKDEHNPESWVSALENAYAQLEHQQTRIMNLQLLLKHGPQAWRAQNESLSSLASRLEHEIQVFKGDINHVNRERKVQHEGAGIKLQNAHAIYMALVQKNAELTAACDELEKKVHEKNRTN